MISLESNVQSPAEVVYDQSDLARLREVKNTPPIFVIGSYRSGTTLLFQLIQAYLDIGFGRDDGRFVRFMGLLRKYGDLNQDQNLCALISDIFGDDDFRYRFKGLSSNPEKLMVVMEKRSFPELVRTIYASFAVMHGKKRWGGKTPEYVLHMAALIDIFPDVKFIHIIRDGRDVALSLFRMPWGAPRNCYAAATFWKEWVNTAQAFGTTLGPDRYLEIKYEDLLVYPVDIFKEIIKFGQFEGPHDQLIEKFHQEIRITLKRDNFNKWKTSLSPSDTKVFEQIAGDKLRELGYEVVNEDVINQPFKPYLASYYYFQNLLRKVKVEGYQAIATRWKYKIIAIKRSIL